MKFSNPRWNFRRVLVLLALPCALHAQDAADAGTSGGRERGQIHAEPLWRQALGGVVTGLPAVQAQSVAVVLDGGNIRAYSAAGRPLWNYSARGKISPFVTRSREGTSYISRTNGTFIAVNRAGRELWRLNPGGQLSGQAVSGWDGRIFVPTGKRISCYTASGGQLWAKNFDERIALSPRLNRSGGILFALENGGVISLDPFGNTRSWNTREPPQALLSLDPGPDGVSRTMALFKNGAVEILEEQENWYMSADGGAAAFTFPRLPASPLAAAAGGSLAAVTLEDGRTLLLSADERKILWTGESHIAVLKKQGRGGGADCEMLFNERGVYVLSKSGASGFASNGRRLWFTTLENAAAVPAFDDDGMLYSGGEDWILYAYRIESRAEGKMSLFGPLPEGSYRTGSPPPSPDADHPLRYDEGEIKRSLDEIGRAIQSGQVGAGELAWTAYLMETATAGYSSPGASRTLPLVHIRERARALLLLSRIGSRETIPFIVNVFKRESDPVMKAAAARAIGAIGVDPDGLAIQAFLDALSTAGRLQDEEPLAAIAAATGALCRFSGPPLSGAGAKILTLLGGSGFPQVVRRQAARELNSLRLQEK